jgi:hypothetical protein
LNEIRWPAWDPGDLACVDDPGDWHNRNPKCCGSPVWPQAITTMAG